MLGEALDVGSLQSCYDVQYAEVLLEQHILKGMPLQAIVAMPSVSARSLVARAQGVQNLERLETTAKALEKKLGIQERWEITGTQCKRGIGLKNSWVKNASTELQT